MRFLYFLAGVDAELIERSSRVDRIWAAQVGISLILTFVFVAAISYFSLHYFLGDPAVVVGASLMVAGVVTLFDRALMISDWLNIGLIDELRQHMRKLPLRQKFAGLPWGRLVKVAVRVAVSLVIALTLSLLAEAALFGPTLRASLERDNAVANEPYRAAMAEAAKELDAREAGLDKAIAELDRKLDPVALAPVEPLSLASPKEIARLDELAAERRSTEARMRELEEKNRGLRRDIHAEETGSSIDDKYTGKPGCKPGSRCDVYKLDLSQNESELQSLAAALASTREEAASIEAALDRRVAARTPGEAQIADSRARRDAAIAERLALIEGRTAALAAKDAELRLNGVFVPLGDDPIARVHQLSVIKADPKVGGTIVMLSFAVRFLIAFLEVAPVVAKIFFSPASAYAIWLRQEIAEAQSEARMMTLATMKKASGREEEVARLVDELNRRRDDRIGRGRDAGRGQEPGAAGAGRT